MIETAPWGDDSEMLEKQIQSHNKNHSSVQRSQEVDRARDELVSGHPALKLLPVAFCLWTGFFIPLVCQGGWPFIHNVHKCIVIIFKTKHQNNYISSLFVLEHEGRQVQPVHPGTRMGKPAGRTEPFANISSSIATLYHIHASPITLCPSQKMSHSRVQQLRELQSIINEISRAIMWVNEKEEEELMFDWGDKNIDHYIPRKQESYSGMMRDLEEKEKDLNKLKVKSDGLLKNNHPAADKIEAYMDTLQTQWSWLLQITKCIDIHLKDNAAYSQFFKEANETYAKLQKDHESIRNKFTCDKNTPLDNLNELLRNLEREKERVMENRRQVQSLVNKSKTIVRLNPRNPEEKSNSPVIVEAICDFKQDQIGILKGNDGILKDNSQRSKWLVTGPGEPMPNEQYYEAIMSIWNQLYINIKSLISWQCCLKDMNYISSLTVSMLSKMRPEEYRSIIKRLETHYQEFLRTSQGSDMFGEEDKKTIQGNFDSAQNHYDTLIIQIPAYSECPMFVTHPHIDSPLHLQNYYFQNLPRYINVVHQDLDYIHDEYLRLREKIMKQLEGIPADSEQAKFLRSELEIISQKLGGLDEGVLSALQALLQSLLQAEDIIKVHEARLTEKETSSLDLRELENYRSTLKQMKGDLEQKRDLLTAMESDLAKAVHWNGQISESFHKCDVDLSKYSDLVDQMSVRWRRIQTQIESRVWDLEKQEKQLGHYQQSSTLLQQWIDNARKRQDTLQAVKLNDVQTLMDHLNKQKALHTEIKGKQEKVEDVHKNSDTCATSIKDYELQLASYSSGLETLLNIPIKRTMLQSPASLAADLQSQYIELLTRSGDYYRFLGELLKNMEELKIRNTKIEMLEEELRRLKDDVQDRNQKNKSLEDALARYKLDLTQSQNQLITMEEVKRTTAIQVSATKDNLDTTHGQLQDLNEQLTRIKYQLDEEKRKRRLAEERYTSQQEEYEAAVRRRQKELEELNWTKIDLEKSVKDKERELERMKILLDEEEARRRKAESDISKVRTQCSQEVNQLKQTYETEIHVTKTTILKASQQKEENTAELRLQVDRLTSEKRDLEEELRRLGQSIAHTEEQKSRAEQEASQQRASMIKETRVRSELEVQLRTLTQQGGDAELKLKEAIKHTQDKSREISMLTFNLEEEGKKRRSLELEINRLKQAEGDLKTKNASYLESINKLKVSEHEIRITRVELEKQTSEKSKVEQSSVRLQSRIRELQGSLDGAEAELERQKKATQEEFTRRKRMEAELERMTQTCREHTTTISTLKSIQLETTNYGKKYEQDISGLQKALDKSLTEHKVTKQELAAVSAQLKALKQKLQQEEARIRELNQRNESLYKTIEEKSRQLNEFTAEIEKLKTLTQNLTKERLILEEELRAVRQERDELKLSRDNIDGESATQISALHVKLQSSTKRTTELQSLLNDLTREREKLKMELDKFQKQSIETSMRMHDSQSQYSDVLLERDSLLCKLKLLEQDKSRQLRIEEELTRIKLTLETELRNKQRLQDEKNAALKEFNYMKSQYELRDSHIKKFESDRDVADRDRLSLKSEIERLMRELKTVEERYKSRLMISEKEASDLAFKREALEREIKRLQQRPNTLTQQTQTDVKVPTIDPSKLVFDGVRRKVTAHQLCDCGIISKSTLDQLLKGKKSVDEVAVDIQLSLKGTGIIAGMTTGSQGKIPFTEAKNKNFLSQESALMLLEAQAATGYIIDPAFNERMPVDTACSRGIVDTEDRDTLVTAEAASTGFKDPYTGKVLSVGQACKHGRVNKDTAIRLLQAQESVGGILDPVLSVFLPRDLALDRNLIDEDLYRALGKKPTCYLEPGTGEKISYNDLRKKCTVEPVSGLLLLHGPEKPMTVKGLRGEVTVEELIKSELLDETDLAKINEGKLTSRDIEDRLKSYLYGTTCIAGIYDEAKEQILPFYQAMKQGLLMRGTTLELLEAQAASGFIVDPVNNVFLTVEEAAKRGLIGNEFKNKLLSAEKAVTGYKDPSTGKKISLFQAIAKDLIEKGHGIRLLEAQIASGGIIDPKESHRIDVAVAYKRGYFDEEMNEILSYEGDDTKGFFDPNTKENLTYLQLKDRCMKDPKTDLILLPIKDKSKPQKSQESRSNVLRKRRVVIVDPDTGLEMSVREAYHRELIDYDTFLELSEQECEWEEITITGSDGSTRLVIVDRKSGTQYDIQDCLKRGVIDPTSLDQYRAGKLTLTQFADQITSRTSSTEMSIAASNVDDIFTSSSPTQIAPSSPTIRKRFNSISITVSPPEMFDDHSPVAAIFDTETIEKITVSEGLRRGIVDTITAQRLLEAQTCTGGIINPATGERLSVQEAVHQSIIDDSMGAKLKPAQKAYVGFEDVKTKRKMSVAEAVKETWLPYEAGQRFLEFQYLTGGLTEPGSGHRITIEEAIHRGWLDGQGAQKLQDTRNHQKNLTCPKTKLKISYKQAMDSCMVEESNGMKLLQASSMSSKGISSPYNVSNPGSRSGSRAGSLVGSRSGSRRGSVDYSSTVSYSFSSNSTSYSS
uniref:Desmoplakin n=1 Tax=Cyclopterus lumpus TaxID=8103 RepID=A0A8C2WQI9_CYCLU